jgi:alanyl-tRNA synthetase
MLGNFSFGDYFKREAIHFAWELLTKVYGLPVDRLWTTVYVDDSEAFDIWTKEVGVAPDRCIRIGDKPGGPRYVSDNFWQMADTGPCGPCSEIFYDHGPGVAGGLPGSPDADGDRYIEVWNLVFMQFDRDAAGVLTPLPRPCVDTGMGLERLAAVLQGVHSNYEIDLFRSLIAAAARATGATDLADNSLKVIADHIRACAFLVADGILPGNEGRGYVLRRIIRRALRHGHQLGCRTPFFHTLVADVVREMGAAYPELAEQQSRIETALRLEEERFGETLGNGMRILGEAFATLAARGGTRLDGDTAFLLYDTYGFPVDLTADVARARGIEVDMDGFESAMERQRGQARAAGRFKSGGGLAYEGSATSFTGYGGLAGGSRVAALYRDDAPAGEAAAGQDAVVVLEATPFYAESGGQAGDIGVLEFEGGSFTVTDTRKIQAGVFGHFGSVREGVLRTGAAVLAQVDRANRIRTRNNHSATHLLHAALRNVLGDHVQQKGSSVDSARTRFDFSHDRPLDPGQVREVEREVNAAIRQDAEVRSREMKFDEAIRAGALAFFGDKYGDEVRVVAMGEGDGRISAELCGGTHVDRTGEIGWFKIVSEGGVAAGVRRVEAVTGEAALEHVQRIEARLQEVAGALRAPEAEAAQRVQQLLEQVKGLERERERLWNKLASGQGNDLAAGAAQVAGAKVLAAMIEGADAKQLRASIDQLKEKLGEAAIVLAAVADGRVQLVAGVTTGLQARLPAGELVNFVARQVGGKGGGRADLAMAGGTDIAALPAALALVEAFARERLEAAPAGGKKG